MPNVSTGGTILQKPKLNWFISDCSLRSDRRTELSVSPMLDFEKQLECQLIVLKGFLPPRQQDLQQRRRGHAERFHRWKWCKLERISDERCRRIIDLLTRFQ